MENQQQNSEPIQTPPAAPSAVEGLQPSAHKPNKKIIIGGIVVIVLALFLIGASAYSWWQNSRTPNQIACTMEAKLCPDGSSVGRTGPNCEFAACPEAGSAILKKLDMLGIVVVGQSSQQDIILPPVLSDANWGLKNEICQQSGYNLSSYAGKSVKLISYNIEEKYKNEPLAVWVVVSDETIACIYKTVRQDSSMAPGVFPVNNETSSWQTYRNLEYGFEVKYPQDWEVIENSDNNEFTVRKGEVFPELKIQFTTKKYSEVLTEQEKYFNEYQKNNAELEQPTGEIKEGIFANYITKEIFYYSPVGFIQKIIIFSRNNQTVTLETYVNTDLDKILSTFKFIE